ncbi:MAG: xylulokinase [Verrucomicrobiota bacterium]
MSDFFIGVDCGTQSTKAIIVHGNTGKVMGEASAAYGMIADLPQGAQEQKPSVWVSAMERSIRAALKKSGIAAAKVRGMGVSAQQHGFVALDDKDQVIRPAKLWCDTSTAQEAHYLLNKLGGLGSVINMGGNGLPVGFTASKILWMKRKEPKNFTKLATVLLPHDYLNFYLTKKKTMEAGDASGTGIFDTKTRDWHPQLVEAIDVDLSTALPTIQQSSQPAGLLEAKVARKLGLPEGIIVSAGGGDNMMSAIGTGNTRPGVVTLSLGTSGTLYGYSSRPIIDPLGQVAAFCDSTGAWLPLICTMNATRATELVRNLFKMSHEKMTQEAMKAPPGSQGLVLLPYFEGERIPDLPQASGVFFGMNSQNFTSAHLARATMEGVTMGLNYGLSRLRDLGLRPKEIRLTGGGSNNPLWRQMVADIFETDVIGLATTQGAAFGAALQAKWCYSLSQGEKVRIQQLTDQFVKTDPKTKCSPIKANFKAYRPLQEFYNELSRTSAPLFDRATSLR